MSETVWMVNERVFGTIVSRGAHTSLVRYNWKGLPIEEWVENDEFTDEEDD